MLGLILTILVIIILLAGVIYYVSVRNNDMNDKYVNSLTKYDNFKKNAFGHITNSLKEIDYLNRKSGSLGSNKDSTCYRSKDNKIEDCECHDSCSTCGYSNSPTGINQCLTCKNGNDVNSLYNNGAGWCGSFNEKGEIISSTPSMEASFSNNEATVNGSASGTTNDSTNDSTTDSANDSTNDSREMTCNERFARMCSSSSDWAECLEKNKTSLVLAGCNITLESEDSNGSSTDSSDDTASSTGMVRKDFLKVGEKMLANEFLQSPNSKYKFLIENNGQLIVKDVINGTQKWSAQITSLSEFNGPYYLEFNSEFKLILFDRTKREIWKVLAMKPFTGGPNVKVLLDDNGILRIKDNGENTKWDSETYQLNAATTAATTATSGRNETSFDVFGIPENKKCPPGKFIFDGETSSNIACSTDPTSLTGACALKGYNSSSDGFLPRCHKLQIGMGTDDEKYKCAGGVGTEPGGMNNYIITSSSNNNGLKCDKFDQYNRRYALDATGLTKLE